MTWRTRLNATLQDSNPVMLAVLASEMATLLDNATEIEPDEDDDAEQPEPSAHAARQARYRERHAGVTQSVTQSVTQASRSVTPGVTQASRKASRDASRASRAVVQDLVVEVDPAVASVVGSLVSTAAAAVKEPALPKTQNGTSVTRVTPSVTPGVTQASRDASHSVTPPVTPPVTQGVTDRNAQRHADAMELQKQLGPVVSRKFRDLLLRHELNKDTASVWVAAVSEKLKDPRYTPEDIGQMADDDLGNPIMKGVMGMLSFIDRARMNRLAAQRDQENSEHSAAQVRYGLISGRVQNSQYGEPWQEWCAAGAEREGLPSWYQFADAHYDDPWPPTSTNGDQSEPRA